MKKILLIAHLFIGVGLVPYAAHAQEFNAHAEQALSTQISTLRNMLTSTIGSLKETLHKYEVCSAKQMLYAPDAEGADSDGCFSVGKIACSYTGKIGVTSVRSTLSITCEHGYVTAVEGNTIEYDPCWFNHDDAGPCGYGKH